MSRRMYVKCWVALLSLLLAAGLVPLSPSKAEASVLDQPNLRLNTVEVNSSSGAPALYINGERTPATMFTQWKFAPDTPDFQPYPSYEEGAKYAGIHIYQPRASGYETLEDWMPVLDEILAKDPKAYFVMSIWVQSPTDFGFVPNADNEANTDASFKITASMGSLKWRQMAGLKVREIVRDFSYSKYRDRILGYMLTAGGTGEWIDANLFASPTPDFDRSLGNQIGFRNWLKAKYGTDAAIRTAWNEPTLTLDTAVIPASVTTGPFLDPALHQDVIDFMTYDSEMVVQAIEYLCSVVKDETNDTRLVGIPYGYTMETAYRGNISGSLAFDKLLNSNAYDFLAAPYAYHHRTLDGYSGWHGFADSAKKHNKLWFGEDDSPTYADSTPIDDGYQYVYDFSDSKALLWKNFMTALTKRVGLWWYDNYGTGQTSTPGLAYELALMQQLAEAANVIAQADTTEIALVLDETSQFYQTPGAATVDNRYSFNEDLGYFRTHLGKIGAPVDVISIDDVVDGLAGGYKMYIFANAYALTSAQRTALSNLKTGGKALVWIKTPGLIDLDTGTASYTASNAVTGLDLRLASSSINSPQVSYGQGLVDPIGNLTQVSNVNQLFTSFTNAARPHMFAVAGSGDTTLSSAPDGKITAIKSNKGTWLSYFSDDISLLTPAILRGIAADAGVSIYNTDNSFVSANSHFLAVTIPGGSGAATINFPNNGTVYEVPSDTEYTVTGNTLTLPALASARTYVFYLGTRVALQMYRPIPHGGELIHQFDSLTRYPKPVVLVPASPAPPNPAAATFQLDPDIMTIDNFDMAVNYAVTYSSSNAAVATVDSTGKVTGVGVGTATITAAAGGKTATKTVQVVAANTFDRIEFSTPQQSVNKGAAFTPSTLMIVRKDGSTAPLGASSATWLSKGTNIATVNASTGLITGVNDGAVSIEASYMGSKALLAVNVNDTSANIVRDIWFTNSDGYVRFDTVSGTYALDVHAVDKNIVETDVTSTVTYTSSNPAAAAVSASGIITPVAVGATVVTASLNERTARVLVEVGRVNMDPVTIGISTSMTALQTQTPALAANEPVAGATGTWNIVSGRSLQITGGGASIHAAYGGTASVEGIVDFTYPNYSVVDNAITTRNGQIRPIYTITSAGSAPPAPPAAMPVYAQDFNAGTAPDWVTNFGTFTFVGGAYRANMDSNGNAMSYYNGADFADFVYKGTLKYTDPAQALDTDIVFRYDTTPGTGGFYQAHISRGGGSPFMTIYRYTASNNTFTMIGKQVPYTAPINSDVNYTITAIGDALTFTVNDGVNVKVSSAVDSTFDTGKFGLKVASSKADFDSVEVWEPSGYMENFDDNQAQGWSAYMGGWNVYGTTQYGFELNFPVSLPGTPLVGLTHYTEEDFGNFTYTGNLRFLGTAQGDAAILFRYQDQSNYYQANIGYNSNVMTIYKCVNNVFTQIGTTVTYDPPTGDSIFFKIVANGNNLAFTLNDGTTTATSTAADSVFASGEIGLKSDGSFVSFDDLTVN